MSKNTKQSKKQYNEAQICSVCNGNGKVLKTYYSTFRDNYSTAAPTEIIDCYVCGGKGWVIFSQYEGEAMEKVIKNK